MFLLTIPFEGAISYPRGTTSFIVLLFPYSNLSLRQFADPQAYTLQVTFTFPFSPMLYFRVLHISFVENCVQYFPFFFFLILKFNRVSYFQ